MSRVLSTLVLSLTLVLGVVPSAYTDSAVRTGQDGTGQGGEVSVLIEGRGFGHGKGLSQYGALGRADAGDSYRQIIAFYYPRSRWGTAGGKIRVLITADTSRAVVVLDRPKLSVRALGSGRRWEPRVDARRWRIDSAPRGDSVVSYKTRRWHVWRTVRGEAEFSAGSAPLTLVTPEGKRAYRGALRSAAPAGADRDRDTVNVVSLDGYLKGVVPGEVPALWPGEAVRAQAVAARTYAAFERADAPSGRHYQICDTARCQVYGGFSSEHEASNAAVAATQGEVRTDGAEPIFAQFSASNGGFSVRGQFDYLPAQEDPRDQFNPDGGPVGWQVELDGGDVSRHWPGLGTLESITVTERDGRGEYGGRALQLRVSGSQSSVQVSGSTFASLLGLRSALFDDPAVG